MQKEWQAVAALERGLLTYLLGISSEELAAYRCGDQVAPVIVRRRLKFLVQVVNCLMGGYDRRGISRWFLRLRATLDNLAPIHVLVDDWDPDDLYPSRVLFLAGRLKYQQLAS